MSISVQPGRGDVQGAGICVSDPKFLSKARGSGIEKSAK